MTDETRNPWIRNHRETVYDNEWIEVWHDDVTRPDGSPGIYGVVHFRSQAVGVVALDEGDRVLLVGQYRYTLHRFSWEIPEGGSPRDEDPMSGAQRELLEETGVSAAHWRELIRFTLSNSVTDEAGIMYVATDLTQGAPNPDATEELAVRWVPFEQALVMVETGIIHDVMSQVALLAVARERATAGGVSPAPPR
jgi:8-oxo-dGTP pyrophosphatase MutT (NUDIX family)